MADSKKKVDVKKVVSDVSRTATTVGESVGKAAGVVADKTKEITVKTQTAILGAVDQNGNGEIDIEDVIVMGLKVPGIRIDRANFLRKELHAKCTPDEIDAAIASSPTQAKIPLDVIDKIAEEVIKYERNCVSGISAALGMPGGVAMVATIPADIAQYYGYMLRAAQKLMYLYGFPAIDIKEEGQTFDTETMNVLTICLGVMYGVAGANNALKSIAKALATGVEKQLLKQALTKGTIYPIVKSVAKWFGVKMTKQVFAGFFKKAIPVIGGVLGGGITYLSFKPCCDKLKETLQNTMLSNPNYQSSKEDDIIVADVEDSDCED